MLNTCWLLWPSAQGWAPYVNIRTLMRTYEIGENQQPQNLLGMGLSGSNLVGGVGWGSPPGGTVAKQ